MAFGCVLSVEFFRQLSEHISSEFLEHLLLSLTGGGCSTGLQDQSSGKHFVRLVDGRGDFSVVVHAKDFGQIVDRQFRLDERDVVLFLAIWGHEVST